MAPVLVFAVTDDDEQLLQLLVRVAETEVPARGASPVFDLPLLPDDFDHRLYLSRRLAGLRVEMTEDNRLDVRVTKAEAVVKGCQMLNFPLQVVGFGGRSAQTRC